MNEWIMDEEGPSIGCEISRVGLPRGARHAPNLTFRQDSISSNP